MRGVTLQVDEVKNIMVDNIERVLERGEKIELLVDKTDNLRFQVTHLFLVNVHCISMSIVPVFQSASNVSLPPIPVCLQSSLPPILPCHGCEYRKACLCCCLHMYHTSRYSSPQLQVMQLKSRTQQTYTIAVVPQLGH